MVNLWLLRTVWISSPIIVLVALLIGMDVQWLYGWVWALFLYMVGQGIGLHRYFSHRGFITSKFWEVFLTFMSVPTALGSPISWAALHRYHHAVSDTEVDSISPNVNSFFSIYFGTYLGSLEGLPSCKDLVKKPLQVFVHRNYMALFFAWAGIVLLIGGIPAVVGFVFLPVAWIYNVTHISTILIHIKLGPFHYRNHETPDHSVNSWPVSILTLGDGWHNNHHAHPKQWQHGEKWWEFDITKYFIMLIRKT
jgi:fatty-acid desaturase